MLSSFLALDLENSNALLLPEAAPILEIINMPSPANNTIGKIEPSKDKIMLVSLASSTLTLAFESFNLEISSSVVVSVFGTSLVKLTSLPSTV